MLIIPTYNEHDNIAVLVGRIRKAAGNEPILFVDDNSPDGTADEIRRIQAADPDVHLLARPGKGRIRLCLPRRHQESSARKSRDYVIQSDADLSHPPELLPRMIELLKTNPVVIGSRYVAGGGAQNWDFPPALF